MIWAFILGAIAGIVAAHVAWTVMLVMMLRDEGSQDLSRTMQEKSKMREQR